MTASPATIHVVDDDASFRKSVARLLTASGYQLALYESASQFLETANWDAPACVLLDVRMPDITGLQLQESLKKMGEIVPIIFLTGHGDIPMSVHAMRAGADDFLTKPIAMPALLAAVERALARDRKLRAQDQHLRALRARYDTLTPKENEVLLLIVRGRLNKQVAHAVGSTERTVKWHRHKIMERLGVQSLAELVSLAEKLGLLTESSAESIEPD
jgi:FixJ family two-component response regulator